MGKGILLLVAATVLMGCAGTNVNTEGSSNIRADQSTGGESTQDFSDVIRSNWKLTTAYINGEDIQYRRSETPAMQEFFIISFNAQMISGTSAPNRISAPYTLGEGQLINITMPMRSTLMATFLEPENLNEYQFNSYLQNIFEWKLLNDNLELFSRTEGQEIRLVFERGASTEN